MRIKLSFVYVIAFLLLQIVLLELHEMVHIVTGYFICGCWGSRDFNVWALCTDCASNHAWYWVATLAGPLFSFGIMWLGGHWLSATNKNKQALGFSLIFTSIPFGRISEAIKGGGDEMTVTKHLLKNNCTTIQMIFICGAIVLFFILPPLIKAYRAINNRRPWLYMIGFLTLPIVFILLYLLTAMNTVLKAGFLKQPWIMGTPLIITLHTLAAFVFLLLMRKKLFSLAA